MFDKDIVMLQVTMYTSSHFIKCLLTQALCTSAYPSSKPFNGKDVFFVCKDLYLLYLCIYGKICGGSTVIVLRK